MGRQLIFCRDVNPESFVLLFVKGDSGTSWSIREYSSPTGMPRIRVAKDFKFELSELLVRSEYKVHAPTIPTEDAASWFRVINNANLKHLTRMRNTAQSTATSAPSSKMIAKPAFPMLDLEDLFALEKAAKSGDMDRILTSPNSEDWVTWNVFALLRRCAPQTWWQKLVKLAMSDQPKCKLPTYWQQQPQVDYWKHVASPPGYQERSRERMIASGMADLQIRAKSVAPVEGSSEIEVTLSNTSVLVFFEAKLNADISGSTRYDPQRNQIARNIDCLLECCGPKKPVFWMLVKDSVPHRTYTRLMRQYANDPALLAAMLPHRDPKTIRMVADSLALIRWRDLVTECCPHTPENPDAAAVYKELQKRV